MHVQVGGWGWQLGDSPHKRGGRQAQACSTGDLQRRKGVREIIGTSVLPQWCICVTCHKVRHKGVGWCLVTCHNNPLCLHFQRHLRLTEWQSLQRTLVVCLWPATRTSRTHVCSNHSKTHSLSNHPAVSPAPQAPPLAPCPTTSTS